CKSAEAAGKGYSHEEAERSEQQSAHREFGGECQADQGVQDSRQDQNVEQHDGCDKRQRGQASVATPETREIAARAAREQHEKDYDGQSVGGMSKKEDKTLNEGNFNQNVAEAHGNKIEQGEYGLLPSSLEQQRQEKEGEHGDYRYRQNHRQNSH